MEDRTYLARTFLALGNRQFRILFIGNVFSFLGMQMQVLARGYLAFELTGRNSSLGAVMLAFGLPQLVLSLWGGVVADRLPKRAVLLVMQAIVAINSAWLAAMIQFDLVEFWMLLFAGVVQGACFAFIGPTRQAFISDLVGDDKIGNAVVLQQMSMNSTRVIGPSIAGAMIAIAFIGIAGVYFMTTVGFILASLMMMRLPSGSPKPRENARSPLADLGDGLRYVRKQKGVMLLILSSFCIIMIGFPYQSFLPALASDEYHIGAGGLGALQSAGAIGAVFATILVAIFSDHPKAWLFQMFAGVGFGMAVIVLGFAPGFAAGIVVMVAVGGLAAAFQSFNNSLTMMQTENEYHGRVQSLSMLSWSFFGLASYPLGILADHIGLEETFLLMGAFCISAIIVVELLRRGAGVSRIPVRPGSSIRLESPGGVGREADGHLLTGGK